MGLIWCSTWNGLKKELPQNFLLDLMTCYHSFWHRVVERLEFSDKQEKKLYLMGLSYSIAVDTIKRLEAELSKKNLETEQEKAEIKSECQFQYLSELNTQLDVLKLEFKTEKEMVAKEHQEICSKLENDIANLTQKLSSKDIMESKLDELNTSSTKFVSELLYNQSAINNRENGPVDKSKGIDEGSIKISQLLEEKDRLKKELKKRNMENFESSQKLIYMQEVIKIRDEELERLREFIITNAKIVAAQNIEVQDKSQLNENLAGLLSLLLEDKCAKTVIKCEMSKLDSKLTEIVHCWNQVQSSKEEMIKEQAIQLTEKHAEIAQMERERFDFLKTIEELKLELAERNSQLNNCQAKQLEISELYKLIEELRLERSKYRRSSQGESKPAENPDFANNYWM